MSAYNIPLSNSNIYNSDNFNDDQTSLLDFASLSNDNHFQGINQFDILPKCSAAAAANDDLVNKAYLISSVPTLAQVQANNNTWTGTNSFNSSFLTSNLPSTTAVTTDSIVNIGKLNTIYQTIAGMASYLTTASASSTYQTISGMASYLTAASASSTYQTIANMSTYALKASPVFTGTPSAPTATAGTNTTQLATTEFVVTSLTPYLTSANASSTYQTISGMASYLTTASASSTYQTIANMSSYLTSATASSTYVKVANNNVWTGTNAFNTSYPTSNLPSSTAVTADSIMNKAKIDSLYQTIANMTNYLTTATASSTYQTITGMSSYLTASTASSTYQTIANMTNYALLASPTFTGTPSAPTATAGTNTTQLATCAFVVSNSAGSNLLSTANTWTAIQTFSAVPVLSGASITSGTIPITSIVGTAVNLSGAQTITGSKTLTSGTLTLETGCTLIVSSAVPASFVTPPVMSGASIASGTIPVTSIVGTAVSLNTTQTVSGSKTFSGSANRFTGTGTLNIGANCQLVVDSTTRASLAKAPTITENSYNTLYTIPTKYYAYTPASFTSSVIGAINFNAGVLPTIASASNFMYSYNVTGKTAHIYYSYQTNTPGTAGAGFYFFRLPSDVRALISTGGFFGNYIAFTNAYVQNDLLLNVRRLSGLNVGSGFAEIFGVVQSPLHVYIALNTASSEYVLIVYSSNSGRYLGSDCFEFSQTYMSVSFSATIPLS